MKPQNVFNNGLITGSALVLSGLLSLQAIGLNTKAVPQISKDGARVGCMLYRSPLAPAFLLQGLLTIAAGARVIQMSRQRQQELAAKLSQGETAAASLEANAAPAVHIGQDAAQSVALEDLPSEVVDALGHPPASSSKAYGAAPESVVMQPAVREPTAQSVVAKAIAASDNSLMICATPGSGKTTLTLAVVAELFGNTPGATFMGVVAKASKSNMCGLQAANRDAVLVMTGPGQVPQLLQRINALHREYSQRAQIADEHKLRALAPVILYLGDYPSLLVHISVWLSQAVDDDDRRDRIADLTQAFGNFATLLTNGRELNCKIWIDGQEFNAGGLFPKGISLKMSLNLRECMAAVGLGLISKDPHTGRQRGGYGILENMLSGNNSPFETSDRKYLAEMFPQLRQTSMQRQRPLCIANPGGATEAEILPDLRPYEKFQLPTAVTQANGERVRLLLRGGALHDLSATLTHIPRLDELKAAIRDGKNQADAVQQVYGKSKGAGSETECRWYMQVKQALGAA